MVLMLGRRLDIPDLHLYLLLAQILPISFTQNLFLLATLLHDHRLRSQSQLTAESPLTDPPPRSKSASTSTAESTRVSNPDFTFPFHLLVVPVLTQFLLVLLQLAPKTLESSRYGYLIPLVLATRVVLFLPYPLTKLTNMHQRRDIRGRRWAWICISGVTIADMAVRTGRVLGELSEPEKQSSVSGQLRLFLRTQLETVNEGSAIAALGWDLIIGLFSAAICWVASI